MLVSELRIWFVRPHPPRAVLAGRQPLPEEPRYNWEPLGLKLFAQRLEQRFGTAVASTIWHLFDVADDEAFVAACAAQRPQVVAFSEIDLLVNEASRLAWRVKRRSPRSVTVVGGKQTSLLQPGDRFPFVSVDYAIAGDGVEPLAALCAALTEGRRPDSLPGLVHTDERGVVVRIEPLGPRDDLSGLDGVALHERAVHNHDLDEYLAHEQRFPAPLQAPYRTATALVGTGCPHACTFCQSPVEYRNDSHTVMRREPAGVADEIEWLVRRHGAQAVFALSPNLELDHLVEIYRELERRSIEGLPITGFVRAADVVTAERRGLLSDLVAHGLRVLSVGLDVDYGGAGALFGKGFDSSTVDEAVGVCTSRGIAVAATVIASPELPARRLGESLEPLCELPLQSVDVRLATAFRNTAYYRRMECHLVRHPDRSAAYFDRQTYRYQTLLVPGGARPRETYRVVREFGERFASHPARARAVAVLIAAHPVLRPAFEDAGAGTEAVAATTSAPAQAKAPAPDASPAPAGAPTTAEAARTAGSGRDGAGAYDGPSGDDGRSAYDPVADLYDCTFADVRVRRAEWRWLDRRLPRGADVAVLDLGCGAGSLLRAVSRDVGWGVGVDVSSDMLDHARRRDEPHTGLTFTRCDAAHTPFADGSFTVVVSFLSLHYLDWPQGAAEAMRLLAPGGRFLCVDMVSSRVRAREVHRLVAGRTAVALQHLLHPRFAARLRALVRHPDWQAMEKRYPLRPLDDYVELAATLDARLDVLTVGSCAKIVAFEAVRRADPAPSGRAERERP